jgi:fibronectin-binding autotransporter adhesin
MSTEVIQDPVDVTVTVDSNQVALETAVTTLTVETETQDLTVSADSQDVTLLSVGDQGPAGPAGAAGAAGPAGTAATIAVGSTTTGAPGTDAAVANVGTSSAAIFDFVIPQGVSGGGMQYPQDDPSVGGEELTLAGAIRRDTPTSNVSADGDYATINVDASGRLWTIAAQSGTWNIGSITNPVTVENSGTFAVQAAQAGSWNIGTLTSITNPVTISDGGGVITVDGNVSASISSLPGSTVAGTTANTYDYDTGAGTVTTLMVGVALPADGGPVPGGTSSNPIRVDPTGSTTQPVSVAGTVTVTGGLTDAELRATAVPVSLASVPSHAVTNAGTFAVQASQAGTWTVTGAGGTFPVTDSGGSLSVDDGGGVLTVDGTVGVSGTVTTSDVHTTAASYLAVRLTDGTNFYSASGGGSGATQYTQDGASAGGESLMLGGAIRRDTATSNTSADGDYATINVDATGRLWAHVGTIDGGTITTITNVVHVDDNGSSLTVDGTVTIQDGGNTITVDNGGTFAVQAAQSGAWTVTANAGSGTFTTSDVHTTAAAPLAIRLSDGSSFYNASGGTQYTEDTASAGGESLTLAGVVRRDTATSGVTADGDYATLNVDSTGRLWTHVGTIDGGTISTITNVVHVDDNAGSLTVDNGGTFAVQAAQSGTWNVGTVTAVTTLGTITNVVHIDDNGGAITVDGSVSATVTGSVSISGSVTPGTAAANLGKAEDAVHADGDVGVMSLAVRNDAGTALAGTSGDYIPLMTDSRGHLYCHVDCYSSGSATYAPIPLNDNADRLMVECYGRYKNNDAIVDRNTSVLMNGGYANATAPTAVSADGDAVVAWYDLNGRAAIFDGGSSITVDNGGTFAVQASQAGTWNIGTVTPGTGATNLGKAEDAVHASGDVGVMSLAVRSDTATATAANGDYTPLLTDGDGRLHVNAYLTPGAQLTTKNSGTASVANDVGIAAFAIRKDTAVAQVGSDGMYTWLLTDSSGKLWTNAAVTVALPAGTNTIGGVKSVANDTAANAWSMYRVFSTASQNPNVIKASAGVLSAYQIYN